MSSRNISGCPTCLNRGFVYTVDDIKDPNFGRAMPCPRCMRGSPQVVEAMRRHAQVRERYLSATLADFGNIAEIMNNALSNCLSKNIIACVYGSPGTGKTHLLSAVVNDATLLGYKAKFVEAQQLFEHFERSRYRDYSADEFYDYASSATVLAIDEVDKFVPSDYAYMRFFTLFNNRYASHSGLTVIATNRDPHSGIWSDGVGPFESRILARHNIIINLGTKDRRH